MTFWFRFMTWKCPKQGGKQTSVKYKILFWISYQTRQSCFESKNIGQHRKKENPGKNLNENAQGEKKDPAILSPFLGVYGLTGLATGAKQKTQKPLNHSRNSRNIFEFLLSIREAWRDQDYQIDFMAALLPTFFAAKCAKTGGFFWWAKILLICFIHNTRFAFCYHILLGSEKNEGLS